jgi:hypothetical protein
MSLDPKASDALRKSGDKLLQQLDSMREQDSSASELHSLDPQAALAMRKHGDRFLAELAQKRSALTVPSQKRRWFAVAAVLVGFVAIACFIQSGPPPAPQTIVSGDLPVSDDPLATKPNPTVPEPSSGLLAIAGGAAMLLRRRR